MAHGPSRSVACGIFPDHGSNPCPLHWQADSQPLRHQGSPLEVCFNPSPLAGEHRHFFQTEIAHLGLMGVRRVLPSASVKNQGPFYLLLSFSQEPFKGNSFVIPHFAGKETVTQKGKAKHPRSHSLYKWGCWGSDWSLAVASHLFLDIDHLHCSHIMR